MSPMKNQSQKCKEASGHCTHSVSFQFNQHTKNSLCHWNFLNTDKEEKIETANFHHVPTLRIVILNIEISNDNEFKHTTSVSGQRVRKPGAGTLKPTCFSVLFAQQSFLHRFLKLLLLKHNRSRRVLVLIFDWEVRHHVSSGEVAQQSFNPSYWGGRRYHHAMHSRFSFSLFWN